MTSNRRRLITALKRVNECLQKIESEIVAASRPKGVPPDEDGSVDTPDELLWKLFATRQRTKRLIERLRARG